MRRDAFWRPRTRSARPGRVAHEAIGMPVGLTQPMYQLNKMNRNSATESATRSASARAMCRLRSSVLPDAEPVPLRNMKTPALARATSTAISSNTITVFMGADYRRLPSALPVQGQGRR